jgi:hypothetical protein
MSNFLFDLRKRGPGKGARSLKLAAELFNCMLLFDFRTRGPGKGARSYRLAAELLEGRQTDFIYACHTCYSCFDTERRFALHKVRLYLLFQIL